MTSNLMTDLEQAATRAILRLYYTELSVDHMMSNPLDNERLRAVREVRAALAALPLTPEQLDGLASGDMVVVPDFAKDILKPTDPDYGNWFRDLKKIAKADDLDPLDWAKYWADAYLPIDAWAEDQSYD